MSTVTYSGQYASADGHVYRADIISTIAPEGDDTELHFAPDGAVIEWPSTERHEPVEASACTLTIISPGDRTYTGLYAERPGQVRLNLYLDGQLWWSGELDPELYEEPYERRADYEVVLTFTDLGVLDRIPYDFRTTGRASLCTLITEALGRAGQPDRSITNMFDLRRSADDSRALTTDDISVDMSNFIDEDGKPMTWRQVLVSILTPLGLRITGRQGHYYVYDLPTLLATAPTKIRWATDSQTLGVDKVYNNIKVCYSPYGDESVTDGSLSHDEFAFADGGMLGTAWYANANRDDAGRYDGFSIAWGRAKDAPFATGSGCSAYRIDAVYSGQDDAGIVAALRSADGGDALIYGQVSNADHSPQNPAVPWLPGASDDIPLIKAYDRIGYLFGLPARHLEADAGGCMLRITLDLLLDCRYNPFEAASQHNEEGDYTRQTERWTRVYVPVRIWIDGDDGSTYHLGNDYLRRSNTYDHDTAWLMPGALGTSWVSGAPAWGDCWLSYYDWSDPANKSACTGWATNRPTIGQRFTGQVPAWWQKRGDGLYVPAPGVSGTLHFEVGSGVAVSDICGRVYDTHSYSMNPTVLNQARWLLYRNAAIELCDTHGQTLDLQDIVYQATIDPDARQELPIDTTNGSAEGTLPTARALYYIDGAPVRKLTRGDITDIPERLLIAAVASQYDSRHTRLQGTADIDTGLHPYTDAAQPADRRFIRTASLQRTAEGLAEDTYIELSPPKYYPTTDS